MCDPNSGSYGIINPVGKLLGQKYKFADPLAYNLEQRVKTPNAPAPAPALQAMKTPDTYRRATPRKGYGSDTVLTGSASGLTAGAFNTGGATLLGG